MASGREICIQAPRLDLVDFGGPGVWRCRAHRDSSLSLQMAPVQTPASCLPIDPQIPWRLQLAPAARFPTSSYGRKEHLGMEAGRRGAS